MRDWKNYDPRTFKVLLNARIDVIDLSMQPWGASMVAQRLKRLPPIQETRVQSLGREDPLEKEMVTHSSILAQRIPWTEEPGRLQSTGSQRVRHDWATSLSDSFLCLAKQWKYSLLFHPKLCFQDSIKYKCREAELSISLLLFLLSFSLYSLFYVRNFKVILFWQYKKF